MTASVPPAGEPADGRSGGGRARRWLGSRGLAVLTLAVVLAAAGPSTAHPGGGNGHGGNGHSNGHSNGNSQGGGGNGNGHGGGDGNGHSNGNSQGGGGNGNGHGGGDGNGHSNGNGHSQGGGNGNGHENGNGGGNGDGGGGNGNGGGNGGGDTESEGSRDGGAPGGSPGAGAGSESGSRGGSSPGATRSSSGGGVWSGGQASAAAPGTGAMPVATPPGILWPWIPRTPPYASSQRLGGPAKFAEDNSGVYRGYGHLATSGRGCPAREAAVVTLRNGHASFQGGSNGTLSGVASSGGPVQVVGIDHGRTRLAGTFGNAIFAGSVSRGHCLYDYEMRRDAGASGALQKSAPSPFETGPSAHAMAPEATRRAPPSRAVRPAMSPQAQARRGELLLREGRVAESRRWFERAALAGDAEGAFGLGRSYDPAVLSRIKGRHPEADALVARIWYQRAAILGNKSAGSELARLEEPGRQ